MVQPARQDDHDYVTKGEFREPIGRLDAKIDGVEARLSKQITYTNKLSEMTLDQISPNWREGQV